MALTQFIIFISFIYFSTCDVPPHIIYILADDLGWNDVGFHGMTEIPTPNIDALAGDSIILNNYYASPLCTPSRASLMTGLYPSHTGLQHLIIQNGEATGLPLNLTILPQHLARLGYENHIIGKWHLGFHHEAFTPTNRGFNSHFGFWGSHIDYVDHKGLFLYDKSDVSGLPDNYTKESPVEPQEKPEMKENLKSSRSSKFVSFQHNSKGVFFGGVDLRMNMKHATNYHGQYLTDLITQKTVDLIRDYNSTKPLFLYVSHLSVHRANYMRNITSVIKYTKNFDYIQDVNRRNFAGHLAALDKSVGNIMNSLYEKNMLKNSIIIFASDNGADVVSRVRNYGSNWPLRGQKFTPLEGGVRVPALVWSPLFKSSPRVAHQMMHITDWLPTLYSVAGGNVTDLGQIDGTNMWEALRDDQPSPRTEMLLALDTAWNFSGLRYKQYKLIINCPEMITFDIREHNSRRDVLPSDICRKGSLTRRVLRHFNINHGRKASSVTPIVNVDCGIPDAASPCRKESELCLFDIERDPCELTDLSELPTLKEVLSEMLGKLQKYKETAVPHLKKGVEYMANPALHGGRWSSWKKTL